MLFLTQSSTFIIGDIAKLLGFIMNGIFLGLNAIGIPNIGLSIIIFTIVTKLLMMPLTIKQQKFTKLSSVMNPEIQAIQKKYKGKKDNESMLKMNDETKQVYAKYGTSPTGGCLQMLIQMPILFALYEIIRNIPAYVPTLKEYFLNILNGPNGNDGLFAISGFAEKMKETFSLGFDCVAENTNKLIDTLNTFTTDQWNTLMETFSSHGTLIQENLDHITHVNNFLGINLSQAPGLVLGLPILIPILAGVSQYISVKLTQTNNNQPDEDNPAAASMKMMTMVMPVMSAILAITLPAGLGLYWIMTAVCQIITQLIANRYFDKIGAEGIVQRNIDKINKKRAKKGLPPQKIATAAKTNAKSIENAREKVKSLEEKKAANDAKIKEILDSTKYYKGDGQKKTSMADKANMVAKYNERNNKK